MSAGEREPGLVGQAARLVLPDLFGGGAAGSGARQLARLILPHGFGVVLCRRRAVVAVGRQTAGDGCVEAVTEDLPGGAGGVAARHCRSPGVACRARRRQRLAGAAVVGVTGERLVPDGIGDASGAGRRAVGSRGQSACHGRVQVVTHDLAGRVGPIRTGYFRGPRVAAGGCRGESFAGRTIVVVRCDRFIPHRVGHVGGTRRGAV